MERRKRVGMMQDYQLTKMKIKKIFCLLLLKGKHLNTGTYFCINGLFENKLFEFYQIMLRLKRIFLKKKKLGRRKAQSEK